MEALKQKPRFEEVATCPYCGALSEERFTGDEGWSFCSDGCGCIEGEIKPHKFLCKYCETLNDEETCDCLKIEADRIATETGLTPRQLLEQRNELVEALKEILRFKSAMQYFSDRLASPENFMAALDKG